jgi:hypothetical protein
VFDSRWPAHTDMEKGWRISVRLDFERAALLRKLSAECGCTPSELLKRSLDHQAVSISQGPPTAKRTDIAAPQIGGPRVSTRSRDNPTAARIASSESCPTEVFRAAIGSQSTQAVAAPSFPPNVAALERQYRHFGAQIWKQRRTLFQHAVAATLVAQANNENARDADLLRELLRLGRDYNLFL